MLQKWATPATLVSRLHTVLCLLSVKCVGARESQDMYVSRTLVLLYHNVSFGSAYCICPSFSYNHGCLSFFFGCLPFSTFLLSTCFSHSYPSISFALLSDTPTLPLQPSTKPQGYCGVRKCKSCNTAQVFIF